MHILMIALGDGTVQPGQDDGCEVLDAARSLVAAGSSVTVLMNRKGSAEVAEGNARLRVSDIPHLGVIPALRAPRMPLAVLLQANLLVLSELLSRRREAARCDLIHSFGWWAGLAGGLLGRILDRPLVASVRDVIVDRSPWLPDLVEAYGRHVWWWLLPRCEAIVCPDPYQKEKIGDLFLIGGERISVLPLASAGHGADRSGRPSPGEERRALYHGPLRPTVGLQKLLKAWARIENRGSGGLRLFLGGPVPRPHQMALSGLIRRLGLAQRVAFLEPRPEVGWWEAVLADMDLLVLPDPAPLVGNLIHKAMALGLPMLVAESGPLAAWLRDLGLDGALWRGQRGPRDRSLQEALFDDAARSRLSERERGLSRSFRPLGQRLMELYRQVLAGRRAAARKGGEHHGVRIAQSGGDGDLRG